MVTKTKGVIGVGKYVSIIKGKITKEYKAWENMISRCYDPKYHALFPTYVDCIVCNDWLNFQTFGLWFDENYIEGWQLDKDIIKQNNKVYGPDTCAFVPGTINKLFVKRRNSRGEYPIGVSYNKKAKKYIASISINAKRKNLGYFDTPEEAFQVYKIAKEAEIKRLAEVYKDKLDHRVYDSMMKYKVSITD